MRRVHFVFQLCFLENPIAFTGKRSLEAFRFLMIERFITVRKPLNIVVVDSVKEVNGDTNIYLDKETGKTYLIMVLI